MMQQFSPLLRILCLESIVEWFSYDDAMSIKQNIIFTVRQDLDVLEDLVFLPIITSRGHVKIG